MYSIKIVLLDGKMMRATVSKATLRGLKLKACRSVSWSKVAA